MKLYIILIASTLLASINANSEDQWDVYTLSGGGVSEFGYSNCYPKSYLIKNILPLNGEMEWDSKTKPKLHVEINKIGSKGETEFYDIIQRYDVNRIIKLIAFSNSDGDLCPFYAWQPIGSLDADPSSEIIEIQDSLIVGHQLKVYKNMYTEYFLVSSQFPERLRIQEVINEYVIEKYPKYWGRSGELDLDKFHYRFVLAKHTDAMCCPSGKELTLVLKIEEGEVVVSEEL